MKLSGELRKGSKFHKGQVVAADYTMQPEITFSKEDTGGISGLVGAVFGNVAGKVSGGFSKSETQTSLLLIDNRSGVQIAGAVGSDSNFDFFGMGSNSFFTCERWTWWLHKDTRGQDDRKCLYGRDEPTYSRAKRL